MAGDVEVGAVWMVPRRRFRERGRERGPVPRDSQRALLAHDAPNASPRRETPACSVSRGRGEVGGDRHNEECRREGLRPPSASESDRGSDTDPERQQAELRDSLSFVAPRGFGSGERGAT